MKIFGSRVVALAQAMAVTSAMLGVSTGSDAAFRKVSPVMACYTLNPFTVSNGLQVSNSVNMELLCPMVSDSAVMTGAANLIQITGWSNNTNGIQAQACTTWIAGGGGACKAGTVNSTGVGVKTLELDPRGTNGWDQSFGGNLAYIRIILQANNVLWSLLFTAP